MQGLDRAAQGQPLSAIADAEVVHRCREGDDAAWGELVARFSSYVYSIAVTGFRLADGDAEDVYQEVFTRTFEHLDDLRDAAAVRAWVAQLTRRLSIDRIRASARTTPRSDPPDVHADEDLLARLDEALTVRYAMEALPEECREILDRFFIRDQSYRAIAEACQIPAGTVASRISRGLDKLRDELAQPAAQPGRSLSMRASSAATRASSSLTASTKGPISP